MGDHDSDRLRVLEILNDFVEKHGNGRAFDHESMQAFERRLAILRMGYRTESREFLKAFDELTSELRRKLDESRAERVKESP